jgi:hypothetical protein
VCGFGFNDLRLPCGMPVACTFDSDLTLTEGTYTKVWATFYPVPIAKNIGFFAAIDRVGLP